VTLIQLVYASAATKPFDGQQLRELLRKARAMNSELGITGLLLYHKQSFFQILEGGEKAVGELFKRIERDPRHHRVLLLSKKNVEVQNFDAWSMGFVDMDQMATKLPGFVKLFGATPSFPELKGDHQLVSRLISGFKDGGWRQSIE
jgi:hypothetical protein